MEENKIEEQKINKKVIITLVVALTLVTTLIIGISYAYFASKATGASKTITTGTFKISFTEGDTVNLTDIVPIKDANVTSKASKTPFTVTNQSNKTSYFDISLTDFDIDEAYLAEGELRWALYEGTTPVTTGTFVDAINNTEFPIASNITFSANASKTYNLYVWIKELSADQSDLEGLSASFKINVEGTQKARTLLADKILSNTINTSPTFSATSTDAGLFVQEGNTAKSEMGFPTYYYKGNVENNYVQLGIYMSDNVNSIYNTETAAYESVTMGTSTSPVLWRIVRINEDGTIRLVQETNVRENHAYAATTSGAYSSDSFIRGIIEGKWYNGYVANWSSDPLNNYVQTSVFCNENSTNVASRLSTLTPSFACDNTATRAVHRAGMLTIDELMYAGLTSTSTAVTSYLDNGGAFWTMTSTGGQAVYNYKSSTYQIGQNGATGGSNAASRGVINLRSDVLYSSGSGTETSPYIIKAAS